MRVLTLKFAVFFSTKEITLKRSLCVHLFCRTADNWQPKIALTQRVTAANSVQAVAILDARFAEVPELNLKL